MFHKTIKIWWNKDLQFRVFLVPFLEIKNVFSYFWFWTYIYIKKCCYSSHSISLGADPPGKPQPYNSSVATVTEKLNKSPRQTKSPDNFNTLNMFKNSTYTKFKTIFKHMLILWWCHARQLFGSQIPVTTGGFKLHFLSYEVIT